MTAHYTEISPDVLEAGEWVLVRGVQRWVARPEPIEQPKPQRPAANSVIACPTCRAAMDEYCRSRTGRRRPPHRERLAPRTCICGAQPYAPRARYCEDCRMEARRESWRLRDSKRRAGLLEQLYAERYPANWQTEGEVA